MNNAKHERPPLDTGAHPIGQQAKMLSMMPSRCSAYLLSSQRPLLFSSPCLSGSITLLQWLISSYTCVVIFFKDQLVSSIQSWVLFLLLQNFIHIPGNTPQLKFNYSLPDTTSLIHSFTWKVLTEQTMCQALPASSAFSIQWPPCKPLGFHILHKTGNIFLKCEIWLLSLIN